MAKNKQKRKNRYKSKYTTKYEAGGSSMYSPNTVQASGQGGVGSTANIVYNENNPEILKQKLAQLEETKNQAIQSSENMATSVEQQDQVDAQKVQMAADESKAKATSIESGVQTAVQTGKKVADTIKALKAAKTAKLALETAKTVKTGADVVKGAKVAADVAKGAKVAKDATTAASAASAATGATGAAAGATGAATSLGSFATSGAGLGMAATVAGGAISHFSDDDDPTKSNAGEYTGSILSSAGTGASIGSYFGPAGTAVGAIGGALYGAGKQYFATRKAKKEKKRLEAEKKKRVGKYNKEVSEQLYSANANARAGELEQKTYSGYDLGRNVVAKYGGMKYAQGGMNLGMPRYGYAA